jgi:hypothetical protein
MDIFELKSRGGKYFVLGEGEVNIGLFIKTAG